MEISLSDVSLLRTKRDVLRIHLYYKFLQYGIKPFEKEMDIILELYQFGGYNNSESQSRFMNICIQKKLMKTEQSVRNILSKYVNLKVFEKPRSRVLYINEKFIPKIECDKLILQHIISHAE